MRVERIRFSKESLEGVQSALLQAMARMGYCEASAFAVRLALEEAIVNAHRHGNDADPEGIVEVQWSVSPTEVLIEVADRGGGFDPASVPDPTLEENLEIPSGRGIMLMRAYMDSVEFLAPGNRVRMRLGKKTP